MAEPGHSEFLGPTDKKQFLAAWETQSRHNPALFGLRPGDAEKIYNEQSPELKRAIELGDQAQILDKAIFKFVAPTRRGTEAFRVFVEDTQSAVVDNRFRLTVLAEDSQLNRVGVGNGKIKVILHPDVYSQLWKTLSNDVTRGKDLQNRFQRELLSGIGVTRKLRRFTGI